MELRSIEAAQLTMEERLEMQRLRLQVDELTRQLDGKRIELVETRHKVSELTEQSNERESRVARSHSQTEQLRLKIDLSQQEMVFKDAKLHSAEKEAELLRVEVQRLQSVEDDVNRRCHGSVAVMANPELEKKLQESQAQNQALTEKLKVNHSELMRLATERHEQELQEKSEKLARAEQQLEQTEQRLGQAEEAIDILKVQLQARQEELVNLRMKRDELKVSVNNFMESLDSAAVKLTTHLATWDLE